MKLTYDVKYCNDPNNKKDSIELTPIYTYTLTPIYIYIYIDEDH